MLKYIKKTKDGMPYIIEHPFYAERERKIKEVLRTIAGLLLIAIIVGVEVLIIINL